MGALAGQLELDVDGVDGLTPIGPECGRFLIHLLELNDWTIDPRIAFGGGVLLIAHHPRCLIPLQVQGESLATAASALVEECNRYVRPRRS